ncbi:hypothetical protein BOX15_Mlig000040g5 [Macrostomum lignano]|uniref:Uncharacterized protein n=1 Tax=Macrostomum lignano TaxID=282301 RepID=A0A267DXA1_9PLAT|nr:hypothetical protein BOX15_Mlig000040g5 [Macrostomum lignano]
MQQSLKLPQQQSPSQSKQPESVNQRPSVTMSIKVRDNNVPLVKGIEAYKHTKRRCLELSNGASVLLISWSNLEQIQGFFDPYSVFLCVNLNIGRLHDPPDCVGLAELCQRLTLCGSKKYPNDEQAGLLTKVQRESSSYSEEITIGQPQQESHSNSILSESFDFDPLARIEVTEDQTIYTFTLETNYQLEMFLDHLCAGLQCPLFNKTAVERQVQIWQAVSKTNAPSLIDQLEHCSGDAKHPYNRLHRQSGRTVDKLSTDELINQLKEFHSKNYSANLLRLVLSYAKTLDEMEAMVLESLGGMQNLSLPRIRFPRHPYDGTEMAVKVRIKGKSLGGIYIVFALPDQSTKYLSSPDLFLTFLMHVDERGGLQDCLHRFGLGYCQCRLLPSGNLGFDSYCIAIKGMCKVRDAENRAITAVFRYLALLRAVGINELQRREICKTHELTYNPFSLTEFGPPPECLPRRMQRYPLRDLLVARFKMSNTGSGVLVEFLSSLSPDRCKVFVSDTNASNREGATSQSPDSSKPGERVKFTVEKIPSELLSAWAASWPSKSEFDADFILTPIGPNPTLPRPHRFLPWKIPSEFSTIRSESSTLIKSRCNDLGAPVSLEYATTRCNCLELTNGAQAILLHSEGLENKSFVCVSLGVGRLHDPPDCAGLAQLCQRLTLLESKKYPNITECLHNLLYINSYQGSPYYATSVSDDQTTYRFEIDNSFLHESLDRLSAGILSPEFTESSLTREQHQNFYSCKISALDCLQRSSGNSTHPINHLIQGNNKTVGLLEFKELHKHLTSFHSRYYSANLLRVAVSSSHSMEDIEAMVLTAFGGMPNLSVSPLSCYTHPFEGSKLGVKIRGKSLSLGGALHIVFPLPDQTELYKTSPDLYVSYFLNSDCGGSLNACQDQLNIATVSAGMQNSGSLGFDSYCVTVLLSNTTDLSKADLIKTENNAITAVFRYLTMLRQLEPRECLFNMVRLAQRRLFNFDREGECMAPGSEKLDPLQRFCDESLQVHLQRYPVKELLTARSGAKLEYSAQDIAAFLRLLVPTNCKIFVSDFGADADHECSLLTPGGSLCCKPKKANELHTLEKLPSDLLTACSASWPTASIMADTLIKPPRENLFISADFQLKSREKKFESSGPQQLLIKQFPNGTSISGARLWFCQDGLQSFKTPHCFIAIDLLTSPGSIVTDCRSSIHLDYLVQLIELHIQELKELALEAELDLEISRSDSGIQICAAGYSQPLPLLISTVMQKITELDITETSFSRARLSVKSSLKNDEDADSSEALQCLTLILGTPAAMNWPHRDKSSEAKKATYESVLKFAQDNYGPLFTRLQKQQQQQKSPQPQQSPPRQLFIEVLVYGNAKAKEAVAAAKKILDKVSSQQSPAAAAKALSPSSWESLKSRGVLLPPGSHYLLKLPSSTKSGMASSCVVVFQFVTPLSLKTGEKIAQDFLFDLLLRILRLNIEQSDVPGCAQVQLEQIPGHHGNILVIDAASITQHPTVIEDQIESFIGRTEAMINTALANPAFDWRQGCKEMIETKTCRNVTQQGGFYWKAITGSAYRFAWDTSSGAYQNLPENFDKTVNKELIALCQKFLKPESPERRKLSIHKESKLKFDGATENFYSKYQGKTIKNLLEFRQSLKQCPPVPSEILDCVHEL